MEVVEVQLHRTFQTIQIVNIIMEVVLVEPMVEMEEVLDAGLMETYV